MTASASGYQSHRQMVRSPSTQCWRDALCQINISKVSLAISSAGTSNPCVPLALVDLGMDLKASGPSSPDLQTYFPSNPPHLNPNQSFEFVIHQRHPCNGLTYKTSPELHVQPPWLPICSPAHLCPCSRPNSQPRPATHSSSTHTPSHPSRACNQHSTSSTVHP